MVVVVSQKLLVTVPLDIISYESAYKGTRFLRHFLWHSNFLMVLPSIQSQESAYITIMFL